MGQPRCTANNALADRIVDGSMKGPKRPAAGEGLCLAALQGLLQLWVTCLAQA